MLTMRRFRVGPGEVAAGLARLGIEPIRSSALRSLPAVSAPAKTLKAADLEDRDGVVPEFAAALRVLAQPTTILSVTSNRAGRSTFQTANFLRGAATDPVVMQARVEGGGYDLAVVPTVTQATVLIDQLLHLTAFPGGDAGSWQLTLPGYAALLATSDLLLEAQLSARLARELAASPPAVTAAALEDQLARGIAGNDTRWAVTAGQVTMVRGLTAATGRMADGLAELERVGLVVRQGDGIYPNGHGDTLAMTLAQLFSCGSVALSHVVEGTQVMVAFQAIFRSIAGLLVATVSADQETPEIDLVRATQAGVILLMRRLLEHDAPGPELLHVPDRPAPVAAPTVAVAPAAAPPTAEPPTVTARKAAPTAATPPTAPPPAREPVWQPTHTVPASGLPAWVEPDPAHEPAATLDPGLPVRLDHEDTGWAHLTCSNGWTCWVDASQLEPIAEG